MWFLPAFELGLWNAWIFTVPIIIIMIFGSKILGKRESGESSSATRKGEMVGSIDMIIRFVIYAYSIFLPLKLNTIWLVMGLLIYFTVTLFLVTGFLNLAYTSADELATRWIYCISRNPMYVGLILADISIGLACFSWIFLLAAIVDFLLLRHFVVVVEEPFLLKKYGEAYREYVNRTPRWIGIPKSDK